MLVWFLLLVGALALFALAYLANPLNRQKHQNFARRPTPDPTTADVPAPLTRKKPDWVVQEVLHLKALMGKNAGCRKVADTFNRLHAVPYYRGLSPIIPNDPDPFDLWDDGRAA